MNTLPIAIRWLRIFLDCVLIILLVLIVSVNDKPVHAESRDLPNEVFLAIDPSLPASYLEPMGMITAPHMLSVDDNTLAAMIAAENAALTESIYFIDIPLVTR